jgi:replication factor C small subunit
MDGPLWTETHAPTLAELPQQEVRESVERALAEPMNLVVHGPPGAGKTAAVRALTAAAHRNPAADRTEINVTDFFELTKAELTEDPRFGGFIDSQRKRNSSKADLINHVLKESASYPPVDGNYRTLVLDNAEGAREDFQQALRRVIEQHHEATQFVLVTRRPASLISPIRSRCLPVPVRAPTTDETIEVLRRIAEREDVVYEREGLEFVAGAAAGNLREAILSAQATVETEGELTREGAYETLTDLRTDERVEGMLADAEAGDFSDARSTLDELLVDEGYSGEEILTELLETARSRYSGDRLAAVVRLAGEIDADLATGTNERIHLSHLLARIGETA